MPYQINGTDITIPPTTGQWLPRDEVGIDGSGHPVYGSVRRYELRWDILSMSEYSQLMNFYQQVATGSVVVCQLPQLGAATYTFYNYSGCTLSEPEIGVFFEQHALDIVLLIMNIRTTGTE